MQIMRRYLLALTAVALVPFAIAAQTQSGPRSDASDQSALDESALDESTLANESGADNGADDNRQKSAPRTPPRSKAEMEADAWKEAMEQSLGLTPGQAREFKQARDALTEASKPRDTPSQAASSAVSVSMQPGAKSPRITLQHGFVTAIEVLDGTGQPWPIISAIQGDPKAVSVQIEGAGASPAALSAPSQTFETVSGTTPPAPVVPQPTASAGNVITVNPMSPFTATNIVIVLAGASRPISVLLSSTEANAKTELQDRVTLLVEGNGPQARIEPTVSYDHLDAGDDLRNVLVGRPPNDIANEVMAELPPGVRAWRTNDELWIRTTDRIVSPAPLASVAMGNMRAYRLPYLPVVVVARGGRLEQFSVVAN